MNVVLVVKVKGMVLGFFEGVLGDDIVIIIIKEVNGCI